MRNFKTSKKKRSTYIYYGADESRIEVTPDMDGVTEADIEILHNWDDDEVDAERRHDYRIQFSLNETVGFDADKATERVDLVQDENSNPLEMLLQAVHDEEKAEMLARLQAAIKELTPLQQTTLKKKFYQSRTNVDIAKEEGVSKMAITNRLKKIYAKLKNELEK